MSGETSLTDIWCDIVSEGYVCADAKRSGGNRPAASFVDKNRP